jgi:hypothetical protein
VDEHHKRVIALKTLHSFDFGGLLLTKMVFECLVPLMSSPMEDIRKVGILNSAIKGLFSRAFREHALLPASLFWLSNSQIFQSNA